MATPARMRSTRRLRSWMVEQINSGQYTGLVWDDPAKTMFRIPWKHAGKQDFRSDEDAAIFKAWAVFKGKLSGEGRSDPASWKTRLRCALNKSPEFKEVAERSQLDISEPYKVYRLVPLAEQGLGESKEKTSGKERKRKRCRSQSDKEEENQNEDVKLICSVQPSSMSVQPVVVENEVNTSSENNSDLTVDLNAEKGNELWLNFTIETTPPPGDLPSLVISLHYIGQEVLKREIFGNDVRIAYYPPLENTTMPPSLVGVGTERIALPEPPATLFTGSKQQAFSSLLPFMEKGVMLASTGLGILAQRYCQGRVFWTGPHTTEPGPHKLERTSHPVVLFSREKFQQELDTFSRCGGTPPKCGITLCFGEELTDTDDLSSKLITIQVTLPWATQSFQQAQAAQELLAISLPGQSPLAEVTLNLVTLSG